MSQIKHSYTPRKGSMGEKAHEVLSARGPMSSADLAEAIDTDLNNLHQLLSVPLREGYLATTRHGKMNVWRVGNGLGVLPDERDTAPMVHNVVPAGEAASLATSTRLPSPFPSMSTPVTDGNGPPFLFGIFSDGRLVLEQGDHQVTLHREAAAELCAFLTTNRLQYGAQP